MDVTVRRGGSLTQDRRPAGAVGTIGSNRLKEIEKGV
jgi:hypothetical protein